MTARLKGRRRAAARVVSEVREWARGDDRVRAAALVGSYARGTERMASDVDLVILADDPDPLTNASWFVALHPGARLVRSQRWGPIQERRYRLRSGLLVEFGFASVDWATMPLEAGTRRVLEDGHSILFDDGILTAASEAIR
jgi:predicted nucleotidyltransferase